MDGERRGALRSPFVEAGRRGALVLGAGAEDTGKRHKAGGQGEEAGGPGRGGGTKRGAGTRRNGERGEQGQMKEREKTRLERQGG